MTPERRGMGIKDWLQVGAWIVFALVFYFNGNTDVASKMAALDTRIAVSETKVEQETKGYFIIQTEIAKRLETLEIKIDRLTADLYKRRN